MKTIGIRRVQFRFPLEETPMGQDVTVVPVLDGHTVDEWVAFVAHTRAERLGWPSTIDVRALFTGALADADGLTELMGCTCTCSGCDPLLARIEMGPQHVRWSGLAVGCGADPVDLEFVIDREAYDEALADAERWDGTIWEPSPAGAGDRRWSGLAQ